MVVSPQPLLCVRAVTLFKSLTPVCVCVCVCVCAEQQEADVCVRKARVLQAQRTEELQKAQPSSSQAQEEQPSAGNKQQEKRRRLEEKVGVWERHGGPGRGSLIKA